MVPECTHTRALDNDCHAVSEAVLATSMALPFYHLPRYSTAHFSRKNTVWGCVTESWSHKMFDNSERFVSM